MPTISQLPGAVQAVSGADLLVLAQTETGGSTPGAVAVVQAPVSALVALVPSASAALVNAGGGTVPIATDTALMVQGGAVTQVPYSEVIDGQTVGQLAGAAAASDTDTFPVSQGGTSLVAQTMAAVATYIRGKVPGFGMPVRELATAGATVTLDVTYNGYLIVVSAANVTITPQFTGSGFCAEIITTPSGSVNFGTGWITSSGAASLAASQGASLYAASYSGGMIYFASIAGAGGTVSTYAPNVPTTLASSAVASTSLTFTWSAPATDGTHGAATYYTVNYRLNGASSWTAYGSQVSGASVTLSGLTASTAYDVQVAANNTAGQSAFVSLLNTSTSAALAAPGVPTALTVGTTTSTAAPLSWTAPSTGGAVATYTVQYRVTSVGGSFTQLTGVTGLSTTVTGLTTNTQYDFQVDAVNAAGSSSFTATTNGTTAALAAPGVPTALTVGTTTSTTAPLSWTAPSTGGAVATYTVQYRVTSVGGSFTQVTGITGTSTTVTGLTASTQYDFQVDAVNATGSSSFTATTNGTTAASSGNYLLTPAPTRQSPTTGWVGTAITMANGQPSGGYNVSDNSATADGAKTVPASVGFAWSSSNTVVPTTLSAGTGGLTLDGHNLWYTYTVTYPGTAGSYYLWGVAKNSSGTVVATCVSPSAFTLS